MTTTIFEVIDVGLIVLFRWRAHGPKTHVSFVAVTKGRRQEKNGRAATGLAA